MAYLVVNDYKTYIQGDYLRQLQQGDDSKRVTEENTSVQAIAQRLTQKYDLDSEFTSMAPYDSTKTYYAAQRVTVDIATNGFQAWVASTAYAPGALVITAGTGYICITANNDATFTVANWTSVGAQYSIYHGAYPATCTLNGALNPATLMQPYAPVFNYKNLYSKDDIVFWKGYTYVCNQASTVLSHGAAIQYAQYTNLPFANVFPDDPVNNANGAYWKTKTPYTIPAGTALTNSKWVAADNRNQTIKDAMVRITVFKLSPLLSPRNRPESWLEDYRDILRELNEAAEGRITLVLPLKQPNNALRTHYGGNIKNQNNY